MSRPSGQPARPDVDAALRQAPSPIYVLLGDDDDARDRALARLEEALLGGGLASLNRDVLRAGEEDASRAFTLVRTLPMMGPRRVVVIREVEEARSEVLQRLAEYAQAPSAEASLLVAGRKWPTPRGAAADTDHDEDGPATTGGADWGRRAEGAVKRGGGVVWRFSRESADPVQVAREAAEEAGCSLGHREARLLIELVGADPGALRLEVAKAASWMETPGPISQEALREVCSLLAEAVIWDLTDAIAARRPDVAMVTAHRLLEDGEAPQRLVAMVAWQLRQLLALQHVLRGGEGAAVRMAPQKRAAAERSLRERPLDPVQVLGRLAEANRLMNSSRAGDRRVLEWLILDLATR